MHVNFVILMLNTHKFNVSPLIWRYIIRYIEGDYMVQYNQTNWHNVYHALL